MVKDREAWYAAVHGVAKSQIRLSSSRATKPPPLGYKSYVFVVQLPSHVWLFATPWTAAYQASLSLTISRSLTKFMFIAPVMPSSHLSSFCPQSFPASGTFPMSCPFTSDDQNTRASVSDIPVNIQDWSPLRLTDLILRSKGLVAVSSSTTGKGINSLAFCLLYGPVLTTVPDHWEDHSVDHMDLCRQRLCFSTHCLGLSSLSCQEAIVFWFHGCSHYLQWFWSSRGNLSLLPPFPLVFAMQ